jgi:hypothetical protein
LQKRHFQILFLHKTFSTYEGWLEIHFSISGVVQLSGSDLAIFVTGFMPFNPEISIIWTSTPNTKVLMDEDILQ